MQVESVSRGGAEIVEAATIADRVTAGEIIVVRGLLQSIGWFGKLVAMCRADLVELVGEARAAEAVASNFERIHDQLSVEELFAFNRNSMRHLLPMAPLMVRDFAHRVLNRRGTFAECRPNMRTIVPHDNASQNSGAFTAEHRQRGAGKVTGHGPHHDSWHGHPLNTVNLWCAMSRVKDGNGMVVYPGLGEKRLPCDASGNIQRDQMLGPTLNFTLEPGDGVVFLANLLHGSELNRTDATRCVVSMRMTFRKPDFPGGHAYRYVYTDWVGTRLDRYARLRVQLSGGNLRNRAARLVARFAGENSGAFFAGPQKGFPPTHDTSGEAPTPVEASWDDCRQMYSISSGALQPGEIRPVDGRFCAARTADEYLLYSRFCPHEGADLAGGSIRGNGVIACPWHNLTFDVRTGESPCRSIAPLHISPGTIDGDVVRFPVPGPRTA